MGKFLKLTITALVLALQSQVGLADRMMISEPVSIHERASGFGLHADSLLGNSESEHIKNINLVSNMYVLPCEVSEVDHRTFKNSSHYRYSLQFLGLPVFNGSMSLHYNAKNLVMVSLNPANLDCSGTWSGNDLQLSEITTKQRGWWADTSGSLIPAIHVLSLVQGHRRQTIYNANTHAVIEDERLSFDASAEVYSINPESEMIDVDFEHISGGKLQDSVFTIYGPNADAARAKASNNKFNYDPYTDTEMFDQVQSYYNANRILNYYRDNYDVPLDIPVDVFTNVPTEINNARYEPAFANMNARIYLGLGDNTSFSNLSRDSDVVAHEFGHHVIFRSLKTSQGESGIIHEGVADYFAYSFNGEPYLAETVAVGEPYLRTAILPKSKRFDENRTKLRSHKLGEILSAFLWESRTDLGENFDHVVFNTIEYLDSRSGLEDFFVGLINSYYDIYGDEDQGGYCRILMNAVDRGFASSLRSFDGKPCDLDLTEQADYSDSFLGNADALPESHSTRKKYPLFGEACGTISEVHSKTADTYLALMLLMPLLLVTLRKPVKIRIRNK